MLKTRTKIEKIRKFKKAVEGLSPEEVDEINDLALNALKYRGEIHAKNEN